MKTKHLIFLGVILITLLAILSAKKIFMKPELAQQEYKGLQITIDPSLIYGIQIKKGENENLLTLEKKDAQWRLPSKGNMMAQSERIEKFITDLASLQGEMRSNSKNLFSDYKIADNEAFSISILDKDSKPYQVFFIGMEKPGEGSSFLRIGSSEEVYITDKDVYSFLDIYTEPKDATINADTWIDLTVAKFDTEKIESIKIIRRQQDVEIATADLKKELDPERNLKRWVAVGQEPLFNIDSEKIKNALKAMTEAKAQEAIALESAEGRGFEKPYLKVVLEGQEKPIEIILGNATEKDGKDRYAKTQDGYAYILRSYAIDKLDIDTSKFFIDNPLKINKDNLKSVSVSAENEVYKLDEALVQKNTSYIDKLKGFEVEKILFNENYADASKDMLAYSFEIENKDATTLAIDVVKKGETYIARLRGKDAVFSIRKGIFSNIFENLTNLDLKKEEAAPQEPPQQPPQTEEKP
ncbi:MAG: DUF4340 domain-containing protein [Candidatus Omnitrophota bacterium]